MREVPSCSPGKLRNDNVAVAEKIDIEVDVVNWLDNKLILMSKQGRDEG